MKIEIEIETKKELLTPGKLPFPEELFNKGALFMKNEDINCIPMRELSLILKTVSAFKSFISIFFLKYISSRKRTKKINILMRKFANLLAIFLNEFTNSTSTIPSFFCKITF